MIFLTDFVVWTLLASKWTQPQQVQSSRWSHGPGSSPGHWRAGLCRRDSGLDSSLESGERTEAEEKGTEEEVAGNWRGEVPGEAVHECFISLEEAGTRVCLASFDCGPRKLANPLIMHFKRMLLFKAKGRRSRRTRRLGSLVSPINNSQTLSSLH